jgi:hypothetical protein
VSGPIIAAISLRADGVVRRVSSAPSEPSEGVVMRTRTIAAAAALAISGAAFVAAPAQAESDPTCVYTIQHKSSPTRDVITWKVSNPGSWVFGAVIYVNTASNSNLRISKKIDPTTLKASVNLTRKTGGQPYTINDVRLNGRHRPDDGIRIGVGCVPG